MQSTLSLSTASHTTPAIAGSSNYSALVPSKPINLRFCGLRREVFGFSSLKHSNAPRVCLSTRTPRSGKAVAASSSDNGSAAPKSFDYDLLIIGAGVGGHGAALHAVEKVTHLFTSLCGNVVLDFEL